MKLRSMLASGLLAVALTLSVGTAPALLAGCAMFGVQAPETFNERVVAGYGVVISATENVGILLAAGKISAADARNAHTSLTTAKEGLDIAVSINAAGDITTAEGRLNATLTGLTALEAYLRSRQ